MCRARGARYFIASPEVLETIIKLVSRQPRYADRLQTLREQWALDRSRGENTYLVWLSVESRAHVYALIGGKMYMVCMIPMSKAPEAAAAIKKKERELDAKRKDPPGGGGKEA